MGPRHPYQSLYFSEAFLCPFEIHLLECKAVKIGLILMAWLCDSVSRWIGLTGQAFMSLISPPEDARDGGVWPPA